MHQNVKKNNSKIRLKLYFLKSIFSKIVFFSFSILEKFADLLPASHRRHDFGDKQMSLFRHDERASSFVVLLFKRIQSAKHYAQSNRIITESILLKKKKKKKKKESA